MAFVDEESCPGAQAAYRPVIGDGQDIVSHGRHPSVVNSGPPFSHQGNRSRKAGPYLPVISRSTSFQDRTSVVSVKSVSVRGALGGHRLLKKKKITTYSKLHM